MRAWLGWNCLAPAPQRLLFSAPFKSYQNKMDFLVRRNPSSHSQRLGRWAGEACLEEVSKSMKGWYGPPILLAGYPGKIMATGDGDFIGAVEGGAEACARQRLRDLAQRQRRARFAQLGRSKRALGASIGPIAQVLLDVGAALNHANVEQDLRNWA